MITFRPIRNSNITEDKHLGRLEEILQVSKYRLRAMTNLPMSPLLELSVKEGVPSVQVGVEPSALPAGGVHVSPPPPRLLPPLSTLKDDFVSRPPLPPLPLLSR